MKDETTLYSSDFQSSSEMMILSNLKDRSYLDVNPAFLKTLEFERSEVVGKNANKLSFLSPKDLEIIEQSIKSRHPLKNHEIVIRSKTGAVVVGLLSYITLHIKSNPYLIAVITDITQRKYREVEMERLKEMEMDCTNSNLVNNIT